MNVQRAAIVDVAETGGLPGRENGRERSRPLAAAGIERRFDVPFVAEMALREKQVQQNYRPIIAVHKWFARRPGTLFRALLLAEYNDRPLREGFFLPNNLSGLRIADPFMGGGTPLLEANRVGCDTTGWDINPMAYWVVCQEMQHLDLTAYRQAADRLRSRLVKSVGDLYHTRCEECGCPDASVKYFLWVKSQRCGGCGAEVSLFPGYLVAKDRRHPSNVFVCASCGGLSEVADAHSPGACVHCHQPLAIHGPARRSRCSCPRCGEENRYPAPEHGPPHHRMVAIEYHCHHCKPKHRGRFFKAPDADDLARYSAAEERWGDLTPHFIPSDAIPAGDETDRLHRWGYRHYREMFNPRQLLGLELLCRQIAALRNPTVRDALATNLSDLLRYQNMLCRYDTMALKSLDIFSVHGFPVGLMQCESNLLGIPGSGGSNVGSGGWSNIVDKYQRAKKYCEQPFEVVQRNRRKVVVPVAGERIGEDPPVGSGAPRRRIDLHCGSATEADLPPSSLDGVFTDPPYFANVQYAELMDFCYVWLRRLVGHGNPAFVRDTTRHADELTGNATLARGLDHFTDGLTVVFQRMAVALKPGAPFAFTYHHNTIDAYFPIAVAMLDAGLVCTAALPCPAEMGGSIHISGTASSIVDTVFVCRTTGRISRRVLAEDPGAITALVAADLADLQQAGMHVTRGDARCVTFGHLIQLAVWRLRNGWDRSLPAMTKLARVAEVVSALSGAGGIESLAPGDVSRETRRAVFAAESVSPLYGKGDDEIPF